MNTITAVAFWAGIILSSIYNTASTPHHEVFAIAWILFSIGNLIFSMRVKKP